jgi:hypothetical protein
MPADAPRAAAAACVAMHMPRAQRVSHMPSSVGAGATTAVPTRGACPPRAAAKLKLWSALVYSVYFTQVERIEIAAA